MKIYLATAWQDRQMIRRAASAIEQAVGFDLHARWVDIALSGRGYGDASPENRSMANMDLQDLSSADGMLLVPNHDIGTGHHIEFGYALAIGKPIVIMGEGWTIFHSLVPQEPTFERALGLLKEKIEERLVTW